jgi:hypothetical protein
MIDLLRKSLTIILFLSVAVGVLGGCAKKKAVAPAQPQKAPSSQTAAPISPAGGTAAPAVSKTIPQAELDQNRAEKNPAVR